MGSNLPALGPKFSPDVLELVKLATIASNPGLWPTDEVSKAAQRLQSTYGLVPTVNDIAARFGQDVHDIAREIFELQMARVLEFKMRMGIESPCHLCGAARGPSDPFYSFGLAANVKEKRTWAGVLVALALNIVTIPLGLVLGAMPGTKTVANIVHCRLALCPSCADARRGRKAIFVSQQECRRHPLYGKYFTAGHSTFLNANMLSEFS